MSVLLQIQTPSDSLAAQLNLGPLQEPEAVPFSFETIGWPIFAGVILLAILMISFFQIRKYKRNKYRREALAELQNINRDNSNLTLVMVLVKRTAIHAFGREKVGQLIGEEWLEFLDNNAKNVTFLAIKTEVLALIYKNEAPDQIAGEKILTNAKNWINHHAAR